MRFDVVVIGGGIAGVSAALCAAARGARVAVVRTAPGVTALSSGAWQGPLPADLSRALTGVGLGYEACAQPVPHQNGALCACAYAGATHANARIERRTVVCGIAGLGSFHAPALARLWAENATHPVAATLRIDGTPSAGWSPVALAAALERDPELLARPLAETIRQTRAEHTIVPAVLGLESSEHVISAVRAACGIQVSEALAVAPSVPGWRLARALDRCLRAAGVEVIAARARGRANGRQLRRIRLEATTGITDIDAGAFVLATGKFAGGGIAADGRFREMALGCPVWIEHLGQRIDAPHPLALSNVDRTATQPILMAGVRTDADGRPVTPTGDVVYEDVVVAGSVRAGVDTAQLGLGCAAEDGRRAGERAAGYAR